MKWLDQDTVMLDDKTMLKRKGDFALVSNNLSKAKAACRGSYQQNLLEGVEAPSGSTLKGKALLYKDRYSSSLVNLVKRINKIGVSAYTVLIIDPKTNRKTRFFVVGSELG